MGKAESYACQNKRKLVRWSEGTCGSLTVAAFARDRASLA
eukprot:COSAG05_NODE_23510_length_257_cov_0.987342_1_plen_39_part_10